MYVIPLIFEIVLKDSRTLTHACSQICESEKEKEDKILACAINVAPRRAVWTAERINISLVGQTHANCK